MRNEALEQAYGDAIYETWRRGCNPDCVSYDNIASNYYGRGMSSEDASHAEVARIRRNREQRRQEKEREEYEQYLEYERRREEMQQ